MCVCILCPVSRLLYIQNWNRRHKQHLVVQKYKFFNRYLPCHSIYLIQNEQQSEYDINQALFIVPPYLVCRTRANYIRNSAPGKSSPSARFASLPFLCRRRNSMHRRNLRQLSTTSKVGTNEFRTNVEGARARKSCAACGSWSNRRSLIEISPPTKRNCPFVSILHHCNVSITQIIILFSCTKKIPIYFSHWKHKNGEV